MIIYSGDNKTILQCDKSLKGKIIIPNGVESIKSFAFKDCYEISQIVLPDTIQQMSTGAFMNCTSLETINIPESVKEIPYRCFAGCINLKTIILPNQLLQINSAAFNNCQSLATILLPDSVHTLGHETFKDCCSLQQISIPKKLTYISLGSFAGCESLSEIWIPQNVQTISANAFCNCTGVNCAIIESENIYIDPTAFIGCKQLTRLYLKNFTPNKVLSAFPDCPNIKYIAPIEDFSKGFSKQTTLLSSIQKALSDELQYMSLYYRLFNMNITQMKWTECPKRNKNSFKEPIDINWKKYKVAPQTLDYLLSRKWDGSSGIGLILGYNHYRALDVDISSSSDFTFKVMYPNEGLDGFINEVLDMLHLPSDYPWVVRSGNGYGFHIIFKSEDNEATQNIDSLSFSPNDGYSYSNIQYFIRIELRWCDHLVLPPSLHVSGLQYQFRSKKLPTISPSEVSLNAIDSMINKYCGERVFLTATYNDIKIELTEINKIKSRHDSYLSPHEHQTDTIAWLKEANTNESKNSLALCYLLGNNVSSNINLSITLLRESEAQSAKFNMLQLYACGLIKYDAKMYYVLFKSLDTKLLGEHLDVLKFNADKYLPKSERYLFFDTETTGLPQKYNAPTSDTKNWPRLVQFSWIITDQFQNVLTKQNHIIKPNGYIISSEAVSVHGITMEYAKAHGENLREILDLFESDLKTVNYIVGHNIDYDKKVVEAEFYRESRTLSWNGVTSFCTMKSSINFCKIPNLYGYRYPKLQELHKKLFGVNFENAHNAFSDISATLKCFWEMVKRGIITIHQNYDDVLPF